jgi:hypothetical protein
MKKLTNWLTDELINATKTYTGTEGEATYFLISPRDGRAWSVPSWTTLHITHWTEGRVDFIDIVELKSKQSSSWLVTYWLRYRIFWYDIIRINISFCNSFMCLTSQTLRTVACVFIDKSLLTGIQLFLSQTYLSYILAILVSPLPFFRAMRVVEAWAKILPPIGFFGSAWKQLI